MVRRDKGNVVPFQRPARQPSAVETTYRDNEQRLIRYLAARLGSVDEARDVVQTLFLKLWSRADVPTGEALLPFLFVSARNAATDVLRARRNRASLIDGDDSAAMAQVADDSPGAYREVAGRRTLDLVTQILEELPEKARAAFVAYKFRGNSYGEIAEDMGISESMVRKYVLRAIAHCAARFEQMEGWE